MEAKDESQPVKILVIDDDESVRMLLIRYLVRSGYAVEQANGFEQAREQLAKCCFDLVTLDISMPGTDGIGVLRWLKEHHPDTGVVMATAIDNLDVVIEAMRLGAYSYMIKPFNLDLVVEDLARALERQRLVAENRAYRQHLEQMVAERTRQLEEAHVRLLRQVNELRGRDRLTQLQMSPPVEMAEAYREILAVVAEVVGTERIVLYRPDAARQHLVAAAALGLESPQSLPLADGGPLIQVLESGQPWEGQAAEAAVPIAYNEEVLGLLFVDGIAVESERDEALNALWRLAREVALVLRVMQMVADLERGELAVDALLKMEA